MTSLAAVATYLPSRRVPIADLAGPLGLTPMQVKLFQRFHGLAEVGRDPQASLTALLLGAAARLGALGGPGRRISYVLHARSLPVVVPYPRNPPREVCQALGLTGATSFTVTHHACASGLLALDVAGKLLAADGDPGACALVLTGEKAFTRDAGLVPETSVFGEGAAACLVRADGQRDRMLSYAVATRGEFNGRMEDDPETLARYQRAYPDTLARVILAAVARAGLAVGDLRLLLPHNVNVVSWKRLARRIGLPADRVLLDNIPVTGHVFCADNFINYQTAAERGLLRPGDRYLMAAAGLGATFSAMVFEH